MILYHINKWKYRNVWPPEGTLFADGRWNKPGQWIIYTSLTISLAKLEILANENNLPIKRVCMTIEVSDSADVFEIDVDALPENWMSKPYPVQLVNYTSQFLTSGNLLMRVPSAQSYREQNFLINVRHPKFNDSVKLSDVSEEPFDSRLRKN
ncbi:MAG: RES family NAD+ phosphorylase [Cyclobacteriaceae bacterium]|nr:RES family NAD+ phosphorylase [Cyclobacteriaceae bacterium]